jgi:class 3 adenylate cyclase
MNVSQNIHDELMRKNLARFDGYEISTEGDAFNTSFHTPSDALAFCIAMQSDLTKASWPPAILEHPLAKSTGDGAWRGLRVRMGCHSGSSRESTHPVTAQMTYMGEAFDTTKELVHAAYGGQILMSAKVWAAAQLNAHKIGISCTHLGSYLFGGSEQQVIQAIPIALSTVRDFSASRIRKVEQLSPSYFDAPSSEEELVVCFVLISQKEDLMLLPEEISQTGFDGFRIVLQKHLNENNGYLCQEDEGVYMIVFSNHVQAITFSTSLHESLRTYSWSSDLLKNSIFTNGIFARIGMFSDVPVEKKPHQSTGRADYFGPFVNRAARTAYAAQEGRTLVPHSFTQRLTAEDRSQFYIEPAGTHAFKGVDELIAIDDVSKNKEVVPPILTTISLEKLNAKILSALGKQ